MDSPERFLCPIDSDTPVSLSHCLHHLQFGQMDIMGEISSGPRILKHQQKKLALGRNEDRAIRSWELGPLGSSRALLMHRGFLLDNGKCEHRLVR